MSGHTNAGAWAQQLAYARSMHPEAQCPPTLLQTVVVPIGMKEHCRYRSGSEGNDWAEGNDWRFEDVSCSWPPWREWEPQLEWQDHSAGKLLTITHGGLHLRISSSIMNMAWMVCHLEESWLCWAQRAHDHGLGAPSIVVVPINPLVPLLTMPTSDTLGAHVLVVGSEPLCAESHQNHTNMNV